MGGGRHLCCRYRQVTRGQLPALGLQTGEEGAVTCTTTTDRWRGGSYLCCMSAFTCSYCTVHCSGLFTPHTCFTHHTILHPHTLKLKLSTGAFCDVRVIHAGSSPHWDWLDGDLLAWKGSRGSVWLTQSISQWFTWSSPLKCTFRSGYANVFKCILCVLPSYTIYICIYSLQQRSQYINQYINTHTYMHSEGWWLWSL